VPIRRSLAALALAVVLPLPVALPGLWPLAALANVVVKPGETLSEIADRNGVSLKRLMQANGLTDPSKLAIGQTLVIPGGRQGSGGWSSSSSSRGSSRGGTVTVRDGDTLSGIADRAGISVNRLMRLNGISDPDKLTIGQTLVVGGSGGSGYSSQAAAAKPLPTAPYTVKKGETVSELAERFGTTTNRLLQLNNISDPKLLVAGTRIAIPGRPSTAASSPIRSSGTAGASKTSEYVVQSGESLSHIADRYNTSVDRLVAINKLADPDFVVAGTRIKLQAPPAPKPAPKQAAKPTAKPKPQPKPAAQTAAKPKPTATVQTAAKPVVETKPVAVAKPVVATKPVAQAKPVVEAKPAAETKPVVASQPATTTATAATTTAVTTKATAAVTATAAATATKPAAKPVATTPSPKPEVTAKVEASSKAPTNQATTTQAQPAQTTPAQTTPAQATPAQTTTVASRPRSSSTSRSTAKLANSDWRNYGPLQVDWANWQSMGGSYVAPTLNGKGQSLYLAINCGARKINTTSQSGQWKSWEAPQADFEEQLVSDLCKAKGG